MPPIPLQPTEESNEEPKEEVGIGALPPEIFLECVDRLLVPGPVRDVLRVASVCRNWRVLVMSDPMLWKKMCEIYYVDYEKLWGLGVGMEEGMGGEKKDDANRDPTRQARRFRAAFAAFYRVFKDSVDVYVEQVPAFRRLCAFLARKSPRTLISLRPGVRCFQVLDSRFEPPPEERDRIVKLICGLPHRDSPDFKALLLWYHFVDGQLANAHTGYGLFGNLFSGHNISLVMLPSANWRLGNWNNTLRVLAIGYCATDMRYSLIFVVDAPPRYRHLLHHVIGIGAGARFYSHGPFREFIGSYIRDLETGHISVPRGKISRFPETGRCTASAESHGIRAHISSFTMMDNDERGNHSFRLRLAFTKDCPYKTVQLASRQWTFVYRTGFTETNEGLVINGNPILDMANPFFEAVSYSVGRDLPFWEQPAGLGERPYLTRLFDPCQRMEADLFLTPGTMSTPIPGEPQIRIHLSWWLNWPMILDEDHDEAEYEAWKAETQDGGGAQPGIPGIDWKEVGPEETVSAVTNEWIEMLAAAAIPGAGVGQIIDDGVVGVDEEEEEEEDEDEEWDDMDEDLDLSDDDEEISEDEEEDDEDDEIASVD